MSCEQILKELSLYLYGELEAPDEERLEQHLADCTRCATELNRERAFFRATHEAAAQEPEGLLAACRAELARTLEAEAARPERGRIPGAAELWWTRRLARLMHLHIGFRVPAGALALIAVGYFGAKLTPGIGLPGSAGTQQAGVVNVRSVQTDASGKLQIQVDDTRRSTISGSLDDPKIRQLLVAALHDEGNAGLRVESADTLKDQCKYSDVRNALLESLGRDQNAGVRLRAIQALKSFADEPLVRKALTSALVNDANPAVRMQAIDLLTARRDDAIVGVLQGLMQKEDNNYVRLKARDALKDLKASVGTF